MNYKVVCLDTGMTAYVTENQARQIIKRLDDSIGEFSSNTVSPLFMDLAVYAPSNLKVPARRHSDYWRRIY